MKKYLFFLAATLAAFGCSSQPPDDFGGPLDPKAADAAGDPGGGGSTGQTSESGSGSAGGSSTPPSNPPPASTSSDGGGVDASPGQGPEDTGDNDGDDDKLIGPNTPRCGDAPYKAIRLGARDMMAAGGGPALAGVGISLSHCLQARFETGAAGELMLLVSKDATSWIRFDKLGHVPWIVGELSFDDTLPVAPLTGTLIPTKLATAVLPGLQPDASMVYVEVQGGLATGPKACRSPAGVTLAVKDHPEATVTYPARGNFMMLAPLSAATSEEGVGLISGLPSSGSVELIATKPGCSYSLAYGDVNSRALIPIGRTPLQAGAVTHQVFNPVR